MKELKVRVQNRYDKASVWQKLNPRLEAGEMGIESDTGRFKYGNGRSNWNDLEYAYGSGLMSIICDSIDQLKTSYPADRNPGAIAIVPQEYVIDGERTILDTPYISLRKSGNWLWTVFADQKDKPVVSSALGAFVLGASPLG